MSKELPSKIASDSEERCDYCSRSVQEIGHLVAGGKPNKPILICRDCVADLEEQFQSAIDAQEQLRRRIHEIPNPRQVVEQLDKSVVGQTEVKRQLAISAVNHYKRVIIAEMLAPNPCEEEPQAYGVNGPDPTCMPTQMGGPTPPTQDAESSTAGASALAQKIFGEDSMSPIEKSNLLLVGPTGSGKTLLIRSLAEMLSVPLAIIDATTLTAAGYVGQDVEDMLTQLLNQANGKVFEAERGIVYIDEIDKLARNESHGHDIGGVGVQQALLKLVEGSRCKVPVGQPGGFRMPIPSVEMDTSNILFIASGAFAGLKPAAEKQRVTNIGFHRSESLDCHRITPSDLSRYGLIPELVGRFPIIGQLEPLTVDDLEKILVEPSHALTRQYRKLCLVEEVDLLFTPEALRAIAEHAVASGSGCRALRSILENVMNPVLFQLPDEFPGTQIEITEADVQTRLATFARQQSKA